MRIFVTGASGFVGSQVTRLLLESGHEVKILVVPGDPLWRLQELKNRLNIVTSLLQDVGDRIDELGAWSPEACIHLAWYAEPGQYLQAAENIPALAASLRLLQDLGRIGCRYFLGVGSCFEYDTRQGYLREESPALPLSVYAAAKHAFQLVACQYAQTNQIAFAWARLFYLYGPWEDERRLVAAAIRALLKGEAFSATAGEQIRDYLHVEDVARGLAALVERQAGGIYNICSGVPVTVKMVLEMIGQITGRAEALRLGTIPYRDGDPMFICGDNQRLRAVGWAPKYDLAQGIEQTINWWRRPAS
jgi:nucleoside-diphosphate-sugar epimerase